MVFRHLPIEGHPGPVEFLGGLTLVPVGGEEGRQHPVSLALGKAFSLFESPLKGLGHICEFDMI